MKIAAIVAVSCMWGVAAFAQPAGSLMQVPNIQFFDTSTGKALPLVGGKLYTYAASTTSPVATYANSGLTVPNSNPVILNSNGYNAAGGGNAGVWLGPLCYKMILKTSADVTIWTQDNVCNEYGLLKAALTGTTGAGLIGFTQFDSYNSGTVGFRLENSISVKDAPYNAQGDGATDDTAAMQGAIDDAVSKGKMLYVPSGTYAVSGLTKTTTGVLPIYCDGPHTSTITRHSSALQASVPLLKVVNALNVTIINCGWDEKGDGSNFTNAASTVWLENVSSSTVDNNYSKYGQSNAFIYVGSNNVTFVNNEIDHQWMTGIAISGTGSVAAPVYAMRVTIANNKLYEVPFGILVTVFVKGVTITGNTLINSSIGLVQDVLYSTTSSNTVRGSATYGNPVGPFDGIFAEGIYDFTITGNFVRDVTKNGIFCQGSQLAVGSIEQLPILRGLISGNEVVNPGGGGISVIGASFDHSLQGKDWSIKGNLVTDATTGIVAGSSTDSDITGNTVLRAKTNGVEVSVVKRLYIGGNIIRDSSQLTANSYYGILIGNGPTTDTKDLYIFNNTITDTTAHMRGGANDDALGFGNGDSVRHWGNVITGFVAGPWFPPPSIPTIGDFTEGDRIENFAGPNASTGWMNVTAGSPGIWAAMGYNSTADCITITSPEHCGTSMAGIGAILPTTTSVIVESTAVTASNAIQVTVDNSIGTALGVTCDTTNMNLHVGPRIGGAYFTVQSEATPTGYKCFSWRVKQQ